MGELVYFSRQIKKYMVCPSDEDFWNIIASHFVIKTECKNGRVKCVSITAYSLQHYTESPKDAMKKKIDEIVSYFNLDLQTILKRVNENMNRREDEEKVRDEAVNDFVLQMKKENKQHKNNRK